METNGQKAAIPVGIPRMNRNQRRMSAFNNKAYAAAPLPQNWADDVEPSMPAGPSKRAPSTRQLQRTSAWRGGRMGRRNTPPQATTAQPREIVDPAEQTKGIVKAKTETIVDEPLWNEGPFQGTHPVQRIYGQNLDFSTFPLLCERVYADLEVENPRVRREMPFCAFQHVMTSMLNATVIDHVRTVNAEDRFADEESPLNLIPEDMYIPAPIAEYYKLIANTVTPQGDLVKTNIPDSGIPQPYVPPEEGVVEQDAGSFGPCTAANHNSYECYVSPLVTSRLVMETALQNANRNYVAWQPLPDGLMPANGTPTQNLLGYRPNVERLNAEGLQCLLDVAFPNGVDMQSRLRWCPELTARVSGALRSLETRYKMVKGRPSHGTNTSMLGWISIPNIDGAIIQQNGDRLATITGPVNSSVTLGSSQCNIVGLFGLRRQRTASARGLCYITAAGAALPGWTVTINANFEMDAPYVPTIGADMPSLRDPRHNSASPSGDRSLAITTWLRRNFVIRKT